MDSDEPMNVSTKSEENSERKVDSTGDFVEREINFQNIPSVLHNNQTLKSLRSLRSLPNIQNHSSSTFDIETQTPRRFSDVVLANPSSRHSKCKRSTRTRKQCSKSGEALQHQFKSAEETLLHKNSIKRRMKQSLSTMFSPKCLCVNSPPIQRQRPIYNVRNYIIYYIQINEIQKNIGEITCIFQKVLFSLVKHIKSVISLMKNINFWTTDDFHFLHTFPL